MKLHKIWNIADAQEALKIELSQSLRISETIAGVLINRGFTDGAAAERFLSGDSQEFGDPFAMKGMERAVRRVRQALDGGEKITVYGDYDVDGITATALVVSVLEELGARASYYIPERQSEGYGLNRNALGQLVESGSSLIISVDCGISATEEAASISGKADLIITDHHQPPEVLPDVLAILNPKQAGCGYPDKQLAGVGVAYKLCQGLWREIKGEEFTEYLEIAALGTIADIVPLLGENRLIVKRGLENLRRSNSVGLRALIESSGLADKNIDSGRVGFVIAPRLNAAGRLSSAVSGVELLLTKDHAKAEALALQLEAGNAQRQFTEKDILRKAEEALQSVDAAAEKVLVVAGEGWHPGVIGIVASRIVDAYYKPTVVIAVRDGIGKGSCRSIHGFDMYGALKQCEDVLEQFGGHAQAAGLTILPENIAALRARLTSIAEQTLSEEDYIPKINIEAVMRLEDVNMEFVRQLEKLEPYGMGNPRPIFACENAKLTEIRTMGQEQAHLRFKAKQQRACAAGLAWNMGDAADALKAGGPVDIAFQPEINEWQGKRTIQLKAQDFRPYEKVLTELDRLYLAHEHGERYQDIEEAQQFFTKAVGVTFNDRQSAIADLAEGMRLYLERQPENTHDANAVLITSDAGREIGYIRAEIAKRIAPAMDDGVRYEAQVMTVTGSPERNFGVNILVYKEQKSLFAARKFTRIDPEAIRQALIGDRSYHQSQTDALKCLAEKKNCLVIMGTGRGKSAIFQSHAAHMAINQRKMTVILYPLRALVNDQYVNLQRMMEPLGVTVYKGNGTLTVGERGALFEAMQNESVDILLTTPEFLDANYRLLNIAERKIGFVVVDECHHVADASRRPAYKNLRGLIARLGSPLVLGVTATADRETYALIQDALSVERTIIDKTVRENLIVRDGRDEGDKLSYLKSLIGKDDKVLIFVNSRNKAAEIAESLREDLPRFSERIGFYHAGLSNEWRVKVETWFRSGALQVVVATSAFGEGIDLPDIRHVVQYHLPFDMTTFNQQCGRAGRDGQRSLVHFLFGKDDIKLNQLILKERSPERETIGKLYLLLKAVKGKDDAIALSNGDIAERFVKQNHQYIGESGVSACLKILDELGLIARETLRGERTIYFQPAPSAKLDLMQSPSFAEGVDERAEFSAFSAEVMASGAEKLLQWINKPIYPQI